MEELKHMEDPKIRKLRAKLGICDKDEKEAAGKAISPNLQTKISHYPGSGGNFVSSIGSGGNFVSAIRS